MATASFKTLRETADLRHLRQIIVGLDEGVILIDPDQSLLLGERCRLGDARSGDHSRVGRHRG